MSSQLKLTKIPSFNPVSFKYVKTSVIDEINESILLLSA